MTTTSNISCNEELGEIICPECEGKGKVKHKNQLFNDFEIVCPKCQGEGKLDWCQQAVGVKPKHIGVDSSGYYTFSTFAASSGCASTSPLIMDSSTPNHFHQLYMNAIDQAAQQMADDVDREIMRSLENAAEHNDKIKSRVKKRRRRGYDYGVFSEFLLFPSVKSEDKDQKD